MALNLIQHPGTTQVSSGAPVHIGSYIGPVQVLNANSTVADSDHASPWTFLTVNASTVDSTYILTVPNNATYLTLFHQYVGTLTGRPVVRLYGEIPLRSKQNDHPSVMHASYSNPFTTNYDDGASVLKYEQGGFDWIPLAALSDSSPWDITLGDTTLTTAMTCVSGDFRSTWKTVNLLGVRRVLATIKTAATGITRGVIAGCFGA
jgi:hypothetical protein